jgi:hypothetical protein
VTKKPVPPLKEHEKGNDYLDTWPRVLGLPNDDDDEQPDDGLTTGQRAVKDLGDE